jgi:Domain of unknown function (DUF1993)
MSHRVDPAAIAEEARTVRLDAVLGPPRRSVPVGDSSTPESRTPLIMGRIQIEAYVGDQNHFVVPNFYFHLTTAYAILRHCGVDIGKRDFLGAIPMKMT